MLEVAHTFNSLRFVSAPGVLSFRFMALIWPHRIVSYQTGWWSPQQSSLSLQFVPFLKATSEHAVPFIKGGLEMFKTRKGKIQQCHLPYSACVTKWKSNSSLPAELRSSRNWTLTISSKNPEGSSMPPCPFEGRTGMGGRGSGAGAGPADWQFSYLESRRQKSQEFSL